MRELFDLKVQNELLSWKPINFTGLFTGPVSDVLKCYHIAGHSSSLLEIVKWSEKK